MGRCRHSNKKTNPIIDCDNEEPSRKKYASMYMHLSRVRVLREYGNYVKSKDIPTLPV